MSAPKRILVIDDEPGMLRMLKTVLANYGYATEEAQSPAQAIEMLTKRSFDAVVSDINMPGSSGLDFLRHVRERVSRVPIIIMTGKPSDESWQRAMEYGAFRYLIKPVMPVVLKGAIEQAILAYDAEEPGAPGREDASQVAVPAARSSHGAPLEGAAPVPRVVGARRRD